MVVRPLLLIAAGLCAATAAAQSPDVRVRFDLVPTYRTDDRGTTSFRLYDGLARYSLVGISLLTEPGFRVNVAQRLSRIEGEADASGIDEGYIEDEGLWRVGKQYLPFGSRRMIRESVLAARGDTDLFIEGLPIVAAVCDGGSGLPRGFVARVGSRIGVSVAIGKHFGAAATSLVQIRRPEESPGRGRGYRFLIGADAARKIGSVEAFGEIVSLRDGESVLDPDRVVFEIGANLRLPNRALATVSYSRDSSSNIDVVRLSGAIPLERRVMLEPLLRVAEGRLFDLAVTVRIRF